MPLASTGAPRGFIAAQRCCQSDGWWRRRRGRLRGINRRRSLGLRRRSWWRSLRGRRLGGRRCGSGRRAWWRSLRRRVLLAAHRIRERGGAIVLLLLAESAEDDQRRTYQRNEDA